VVRVGVGRVSDRRAGRDMSARRPPAGDEAFGVHAKLLTIGTYPANGAAGVLSALIKHDALPVADSIVRQANDHASFGKVLRLLHAGKNSAAGPAAAEEKNQDGS